MSKCVMCDREIPRDRAPSDTCSADCAIDKETAWNYYIAHNKKEIMAAAIKEWRREHRVGKG